MLSMDEEVNGGGKRGGERRVWGETWLRNYSLAVLSDSLSTVEGGRRGRREGRKLTHYWMGLEVGNVD